MSFSTLLAQEKVKKILQGLADNGRIANGYLFAGPAQCGKTTAAKEFIKLINCTGKTTKPCNNCLSCQKMDSQTAVDFIELTVENSIGIEQVRELKKQVQYGPYESNFLAVLVPAAEKFTNEAANSFLKLLEEPPEKVFFILETINPDQMLKTILSRCQLVTFEALPETALAKILENRYPGQEINRALEVSGGLLPLADLYLQEQNQVSAFLSELDNLPQKNYCQIIDLADQFSQKKELGNKTVLTNYLSIGLKHFRNTLKLSHAKIILEYLRVLQKNVNLKLTLTALFLRLKEVKA